MKTLPTRPLGEVSNFVAEGLGHATPNNVLATWSELQPRLPQDVPEAQRRLAALDLKMLEWKLIHSGIEAPTSLIEAVDAFCAPAIAGLTYEDLVLVNPAQDLRTFTAGRVGEQEAIFYSQHRQIEDSMTKAIAHLADARELLMSGNLNEAVRRLKRVNREDLAWLIGGTIGLGENMDPEAFEVFRKYLNPHPARKLKGPSGAFSGTIPTIDIEIRGKLEPEYCRYLEDNWRYIPLCDQPALVASRNRSEAELTVWHLAKASGDAQTLSALELLAKTLRVWRGYHYRAVKQQIPEAIAGRLIGTGDEADPGKFLRNRIRNTK